MPTCASSIRSGRRRPSPTSTACWSTTRCSATTPTMKPQPQMVGKYEISPDRLTYTFTLRDGLKFHDGSPVTTKDVIASLKRWGAKDGVGQRLMGFVTALDAVDDKTFRMVLQRALRHGAGVARQDRQLDRRHHAREGCADRPAAAGQGSGRLRPLHLRQGPVGAGQQGGLPQEQGLRAAARQRAAVVLRRRQDSRASTASSWSGSPIRRRRCRRWSTARSTSTRTPTSTSCRSWRRRAA